MICNIKLVLVFLFLLACSVATAQEILTKPERLRKRALDTESIRLGKQAMLYRPDLELKLGDTLPDVSLQMIGCQTPMINTRELRGQYVIVSFWNTYCSTCMETFNKLEKLVPRYGKRIRILPVTFEVTASINWFYERRKEMGKPMPFPSAVQDTMLRKFFPHYGDPHEVWINPQGVVVAVTGPGMLTEEKLNDFISGKAIPSEKKYYPYDPDAEVRVIPSPAYKARRDSLMLQQKP